MKFKQNKNVTALNLAILELDYKFRSMPFDHHNWAPLWNDTDEIYHPQDFLGEYYKIAMMAYLGTDQDNFIWEANHHDSPPTQSLQ